MEITQAQHGDILVIGPKGKLDANTSKMFEELVMPLIDQGHKKILADFAQLDYISSAGLRVLLLAARKLSESGGKIALCSLKPSIKTVFDIAGFSTVFSVFATQEEAITGFTK